MAKSPNRRDRRPRPLRRRHYTKSRRASKVAAPPKRSFFAKTASFFASVERPIFATGKLALFYAKPSFFLKRQTFISANEKIAKRSQFREKISQKNATSPQKR
jgi:hypothetical protein